MCGQTRVLTSRTQNYGNEYLLTFQHLVASFSIIQPPYRFFSFFVKGERNESSTVVSLKLETTNGVGGFGLVWFGLGMVWFVMTS